MCAIFENVWNHKLPSVFLVSRVFIALRPMGFRSLDRLVSGYRTFNWPRTASLPDAKLAIYSRCRNIASRPSSLDVLQCINQCICPLKCINLYSSMHLPHYAHYTSTRCDQVNVCATVVGLRLQLGLANPGFLVP